MGRYADIQSGLRVVSQLKVNDAAERGVQLITRYMKGNKFTMDEEGRRLLLAVSEERKKTSLKRISKSYLQPVIRKSNN